jgi:multiple RNA-binding domain-containing protein 1
MGGKLERSDTTMLVKNLPYETTEEELRTLFEAYGTLGRLVLTPSRALALVEFIEVSPARAAFRALNYSRFHHLPLYLEWAPAGIFRTAFDPSRRKAEKDKKQKKSKAAAAGEKEEAEKGDAEGAEDRAGAPAEEAEEEEADGQARTLFVKNLNFATTEVRGNETSLLSSSPHAPQESLRKHFEAVAAVRSATIVKKRGAKEGAQSMGYGFVEFANHEARLCFFLRLSPPPPLLTACHASRT